jgi:hypothetical protein
VVLAEDPDRRTAQGVDHELQRLLGGAVAGGIRIAREPQPIRGYRPVDVDADPDGAGGLALLRVRPTDTGATPSPAA